MSSVGKVSVDSNSMGSPIHSALSQEWTTARYSFASELRATPPFIRIAAFNPDRTRFSCKAQHCRVTRVNAISLTGRFVGRSWRWLGHGFCIMSDAEGSPFSYAGVVAPGIGVFPPRSVLRCRCILFYKCILIYLINLFSNIFSSCNFY